MLDSINEQVKEIREAESYRLRNLKKFYQGLGSLEHNFIDNDIPLKRLEQNKRIGNPNIRHKVAQRAILERACISSITHRKIINQQKQPYDVRVFSGYTEIKRRFDSEDKYTPVPPDRTGSGMNRFSKKSRLRMIKKCNRINHAKCSLPFFVHLTYGVNANVCSTTKKDLDVFLKRLRRLCQNKFGTDLRYIWKMEFQKRGAVHYHIAVELGNDSDISCFPAPTFQGSKLQSYDFVTRLRHWVAVNWNDVINGSYKNLIAGTGVDAIEEWTAFSAYASKYMQKRDSNYREVINYETGEFEQHYQPTGRFWGMSQNWDMSAIFECTITKESRDELQEAFTSIAGNVYEDRKRYIFENYPAHVAQIKLFHAERSYKNQCKAINLSYTYSLYSKPIDAISVLNEMDTLPFNYRFNDMHH